MENNNPKKIKYESVSKPDSCPACGSIKIAVIMYGLPAKSPQLTQDVKDGKIVFGGCCITGNDPSWKCLDCLTFIFRHR
jgi:hypothetical protein